jgi:hypothetical protein
MKVYSGPWVGGSQNRFFPISHMDSNKKDNKHEKEKEEIQRDKHLQLKRDQILHGRKMMEGKNV